MKEGATGSERVFERFDVVCGTGVGVRDWLGVGVDAWFGVAIAGVESEIGFRVVGVGVNDR